MTATEGTKRPIRRALVSVYDKSGLEELAQGLHAAGVQLVSTGSTAGRIAAAGVPVTKVEELTGFPECLDGRVKTLHPKVHAGILADLRLTDHQRQLADLGVEPFDLVIVNLYPFRETVASGATPDECVEQIDIGGPSMVRAAAKNHPSVSVVVNPDRYGDVLEARRRRRLRPGRPQAAGRRGVPAHRRVRRRRRLVVRGRLRRRRRLRLPRVPRLHLRAQERAALRREPAPGRRAVRQRRGRARRRRAAARQGDVLQQLHGHRGRPPRRLRPVRAVRRDHQARQPVRHRGRSRTSPRRTARRTSATRCPPSAA